MHGALRQRRCKTDGMSISRNSARERLRAVCVSNDVDASWNLWSQEAEASLVRANQTAGEPALAAPSSFIGRGSFFLRT